MRLIDADELEEEICKQYRHFSQRIAISPVFEAIKKAPSLNLSDAVIAEVMQMDDLISRQAAIDALEEPRKVSDTWTDEYAVGERAQWEKDVKALNSLLSAQPERKEGRWMMEKVYEDEYGNEQFNYFCSECEAPAYEFFQPYCHRCGAKMRGEQDD